MLDLEFTQVFKNSTPVLEICECEKSVFNRPVMIAKICIVGMILLIAYLVKKLKTAKDTCYLMLNNLNLLVN